MSLPERVLVTGASGYIAKHILVKLLNAGCQVIGSVRGLARAAEVRAAVAPVLDDPAGLDERLSFVTLDLEEDRGWAGAMTGVDAVIHAASPFPMSQPDEPQMLIRPAVDGTLRALRAARAAGVGRVVMTSSSVAIVNRPLPPGREVYSEQDWTDTDGPLANAYARSKTLAERAAWSFVRDEAQGIALSTITRRWCWGRRWMAPMAPRCGWSSGCCGRVTRCCRALGSAWSMCVTWPRCICARWRGKKRWASGSSARAGSSGMPRWHAC